jgi:hypothetical protein
VLGNSNIAMQFWPLYNIVNEKGTMVLMLAMKFTFRRMVYHLS